MARPVSHALPWDSPSVQHGLKLEQSQRGSVGLYSSYVGRKENFPGGVRTEIRFTLNHEQKHECQDPYRMMLASPSTAKSQGLGVEVHMPALVVNYSRCLKSASFACRSFDDNFSLKQI